MDVGGLDNIVSGGGGALGGGALIFFVLKGKIDDLLEWKKEHTTEADRRQTAYDARFIAIEIRLGTGEQKFDDMADDIKEMKADLKTLLMRRRDDRKDE